GRSSVAPATIACPASELTPGVALNANGWQQLRYESQFERGGLKIMCQLGFQAAHQAFLNKLVAVGVPGDSRALNFIALFQDWMDQIDDRVDNPAEDKEQNCPHHIVDLPPQFGRRPLHRLRSPEDALQE